MASWSDLGYLVPGYNAYKLYNDAGGVSGIKNTVEGDPASATSGLNQLMSTAFQQGNHINSMLQGEKGQSEQYYKPMQQMFGSMYGTGGVKPGVAPGMPGSSPISGMFPQKGSA